MNRWLFVIKRLKAIKYFLADKKVRLYKKAIIIGGLIYLFSPIDLIPAPVLGFSILDDLTLWGFILYYFKDELDTYWKDKNMLSTEKYKDKIIIEDVKYEEEDVKEE